MKRAVLAGLSLTLVACPGPSGAPPPGTVAAGNGLSVLLITVDTLRADHMGTYGYRRATSPRMDALARRAVVFDRAYTFWPKTRGSFVALMTGRRPSLSGYSKTHPMLLGMNPTLASVLRAAGYATAAIVDNPNVAASLGYGKGFDQYRETWEDKALATEMDRTKAITHAGIEHLRAARADRPFLLWLHYVNPHTPYRPPPPFDRMFQDAAAASGPSLPVVNGLHGGIPRQWAVPGQDRLGYYVAQYDGEIATVDQQIGQVIDALEASAARERTMVVLTSDHGESLGEHNYYFDHGEDLFDPSLRIPLIVALPGGRAGHRSGVFASTLDIVPTILDAVKVSYPPELVGESVLPALTGADKPVRARLFAQNDRNLLGTFDRRFKLVATPGAERNLYALYDLEADPGETRNVAASHPDALRGERRELELYEEQTAAEWARTRRLVEGERGEGPLSREACEKLKAMGYIQQGCEP